MRKVLSIVFAVLCSAFGITALGFANELEVSTIGVMKFLAQIAILWALAGICGWTAWRLSDEKHR